MVTQFFKAASNRSGTTFQNRLGIQIDAENSYHITMQKITEEINSQYIMEEWMQCPTYLEHLPLVTFIMGHEQHVSSDFLLSTCMGKKIIDSLIHYRRPMTWPRLCKRMDIYRMAVDMYWTFHRNV